MKNILLAVFLLIIKIGYSQNYFPPTTGAQWDTVSPQTLGWCVDRLDTVYNFLAAKDTKGFLILKNGKIAAEKYFGDFTQDSLWYWASAGKSLTAFLVGIAQQEGKLNSNDTASKYLGKGWTSCTPEQEELISVKNLLSMTSGLDDMHQPDPDCTQPSCFQYKADAGTRWAYHSGAYYMLHAIIDSATGQNINVYTQQKIKNAIGMGGLWAGTLYVSKLRDMARFGLLALNKGKWSNTTLLGDTAYFNAMVNSSQNINPSYGYLWWLNGKASYKTPVLQASFNGPLVPNAPMDMYAALGKNDQKIYVVPSMDIVVVRMGNSAGQPVLAVSSFDNELWGLLKNVFCTNVAVQPVPNTPLKIYPNPVGALLTVETDGEAAIEIFSVEGKVVYKATIANTATIPTHTLKSGLYTLRINSPNGIQTLRFCKQ